MRWLPLFVASFILWAPTLVGAQGLVPVQCQSPSSCGTCEFVQLINNIISFLVTFASIAATLLIIFGGFKLVVSAGNVSAKQGAKETIVNTLIGYVIILAAFLIINTGLGILLPGDSPALGWQRVQCLYPIQPVGEFAPESQIGGAQNAAFTLGDVGQNRGVCNFDNLDSYFGNQTTVAQCVAYGESTCGANLNSTTDFISTGEPFSFGTFQINITVHQIEGCAGNGASSNLLDCPAAFSGTDYDARIVNRDLYDQCRQALYNPACTLQNAARLQARDGWGIWSAYSNNGCG